MSLASQSSLLLKWPQEQSNAHSLRPTTQELNPSSLEDFLFSLSFAGGSLDRVRCGFYHLFCFVAVCF